MQANSFIEGLSATPFHDTRAPEFQWARTLEANWQMIADELSAALQQNPRVQPEADTSEWVAAVRQDALAYGPEWRTLVLQDRGRWDDARMRLFPKTVNLLKVCPPVSANCGRLARALVSHTLPKPRSQWSLGAVTLASGKTRVGHTETVP
jgi:hypothetical protein